MPKTAPVLPKPKKAPQHTFAAFFIVLMASLALVSIVLQNTMALEQKVADLRSQREAKQAAAIEAQVAAEAAAVAQAAAAAQAMAAAQTQSYTLSGCGATFDHLVSYAETEATTNLNTSVKLADASATASDGAYIEVACWRNSGGRTLEQWLAVNVQYNHYGGSGTATTVGGRAAMQYEWAGTLGYYRGVAVLGESNRVALFTVGATAATAQTVSDFESLVSSVVFDDTVR